MPPTRQDAFAETPIPGNKWLKLSDEARLAAVNDAIRCKAAAAANVVMIVSAHSDGQVIAHLRKSIPANERGTLLLDLEEILKKFVDPGLCVWLEALGDRNSLRNLRGIEVKS